MAPETGRRTWVRPTMNLLAAVTASYNPSTMLLPHIIANTREKVIVFRSM